MRGAVAKRADAPGRVDLAAVGGVRDPGGLRAAAVDERDHARERLLAAHKVAGAVHGVDHPTGFARAHLVDQRGVGGGSLFAHHGDVEQVAQGDGEELLGLHIGVRHQVPLVVLGANLVLPPATASAAESRCRRHGPSRRERLWTGLQ